MTTNNIEILKDAYSAFGRRGIGAVLAATSPATEWKAVEPGGGAFHGHEALRSFLQSLPALCQTLAVKPDAFVADGDLVVVLGRHRGERTATGARLDVPFAHAITMKDSRVARLVQYTDTAALVRAVTAAR